MFNTPAIDVAIGLVFVFLLYSLLATIIKELIAHILSLRARMLYKGIRKMLEDGSAQTQFIEKFYNHPAIKYLAENRVFDKPSYLGTDTFTQTLVHLLRGEKYTNAENQMEAIGRKLEEEFAKIAPEQNPFIAKDTLEQLNNLFIDAQGDIDRFKNNIAQWYDETMERVTGWYKRQAQWVLLGIGFAIAIVGNVDTVKLYHILANNRPAREQMVQMAIKSQEKYTAAISTIRSDTVSTKDSVYINKLITTGDSVLDKTYGLLQSDIQNAGNVLGMGWYNSAKYKQFDSTKKLIARFPDSIARASASDKIKLSHQLDSMVVLNKKLDGEIYDRFSLSSIPGWLLTALALSLGAPFWFDLLNKLIKLRATGKKPEPATDTTTTTPEAKKTAAAVIPVLRKG